MKGGRRGFGWTGRFAGCVLPLLLLASWADAAVDWRADWQTLSGFSLEADTEGYSFPTAIVFVPDPGPAPDDPLYFVTEIRGRVKVVTNDRTVHTFTDSVVGSRPSAELPELAGETGMAGIALDPEHGYVFVSYSDKDAEGVLRNHIKRFESRPGVFSLEAGPSVSFSEIFARDPSDQSHQIGPMLIRDGHLFVSVGDARRTERSRSLDSTLGKVLRMTLDGKPAPDNPFYENDDVTRPANYVWAYGLRNPFGLTEAEGRLFATDNGPAVDRFVRIVRGADYRYDGTDWSMGVRAKAVLAPAVGPVQVAWLPPGNTLFPEEFRSRFYVAFGGFLGSPPGPGLRGERSVVSIPYDFEQDAALSAPQPFVEYRGKGIQLPVNVAVGPDGLYIVPLLPDSDGVTRILRARYTPDHPHPFLIGRDASARTLMQSKGCFGCHSFDAEQVTMGPTLDPDLLVSRLSERLDSREYLERLDRLDESEDEFYRSTRDAREEVRSARGDDRMIAFVKHQILHPRFDDPESQMADLGLTVPEATLIARYLVQPSGESSLLDHVKRPLVRMVPKPRLRHLFVSFALGLAGGLLVAAVAVLAVVAIRRQRGRTG